MHIAVREGVDRATLRKAAGHLPGSAIPGERGNAVLAAHRDRHFGPLRYIREGDAVFFATARSRKSYRVQSIAAVSPNEISVLRKTNDTRLTLVTCYPF